MTQHFDKERRQVGLHGLYTKYQKYVLPLAANFCLQSNLLVTLMLKHDYGTQADIRKILIILYFKDNSLGIYCPRRKI